MKRLLQISNYLYIHLIYIINYQDDLFFLLKNYFFTITYYHRFIDIAWVSTLIISFFLILDELNKLKIENITYKNINNNLLNNYHKVSQELTNYRIFKHNIYANLLSLKYQNDKAPYIDNLLVKFTNKKTIKYSNPNIFEDFIYNHVYEYQNLNSKIEIKLKDSILKEIDSKQYLNFFETLSILINNACEAAISTNQKIIYITIYQEDNYLKVSIINTFNHNLDIESFGQLNYSTKHQHSGYGIYSILKNHQDINFKILDDLFISEFKINI